MSLSPCSDPSSAEWRLPSPYDRTLLLRCGFDAASVAQNSAAPFAQSVLKEVGFYGKFVKMRSVAIASFYLPVLADSMYKMIWGALAWRAKKTNHGSWSDLRRDRCGVLESVYSGWQTNAPRVHWQISPGIVAVFICKMGTEVCNVVQSKRRTGFAGSTIVVCTYVGACVWKYVCAQICMYVCISDNITFAMPLIQCWLPIAPHLWHCIQFVVAPTYLTNTGYLPSLHPVTVSVLKDWHLHFKRNTSTTSNNNK